MTSAKIFRLGNGHTRALLVDHLINHTDNITTWTSATSTYCPDCGKTCLSIDDGFLHCGVCGLHIRLIAPNKHYCNFCGSSEIKITITGKNGVCNACLSETIISDQTVSESRNIYYKSMKCSLCSLEFIANVNYNELLCPSCKRGQEDDMDDELVNEMKDIMFDEARIDYETTLDVFGFHDEFNNYHRYDDE